MDQVYDVIDLSSLKPNKADINNPKECSITSINCLTFLLGPSAYDITGLSIKGDLDAIDIDQIQNSL